MNDKIKKVLIGDTIKFTWINSGVSMSPTFEVFTGSETVVNTGTFTDSGNGFYYHDYTVNSTGYYNLKGIGIANSKPYIRQHKIKGVTGGVD